MVTLARATLVVSAGDMKRALQEERDFKRDRYGHNHAHGKPSWSRITYLAHAKGYVMARRPACTPFVLSEKEWLEFPYFDPGVHR